MAITILNSSLPGLHTRKKSTQLFLLACLLTVALFAISFQPNLPDLHGIANNFAGSSRITEKSVLDDVFNSSLGFEKILTVSLPERSDHRDRFILQCALSNLKIEFVDGVYGDTVAEKVLPADHAELSTTEKGSWRAHMNAIEHVVRNKLGSAMICEDDVDWDVRIKDLLRNFAISAQAIVASSEREVYFHDLPNPSIKTPDISPYGDDFDLLWLGHCGTDLPVKKVIQLNDESVPETQYLHSWLMGEFTPLAVFPNHTRVVGQNTNMLVCSLVYAVSQKGARKILYDLGLQKLTGPFDLMLQTWCSNPENICITALPQLFDHHRAKGSMSLDSDIRVSEGIRDAAITNNVRLSVAMNMQKLLDGDTDYYDQYPDTV